MQRDERNAKKVKPPFHPRLVLAAAIFPGIGQLLNDQPTRALLFSFSMIVLGYVTDQYAAPDASFIGRYAGGVFIYALSFVDAYKWAKIRWEIFHRPTAAPAPNQE